MNRNQIRTILIIALIAWCLAPLFVGCKGKENRQVIINMPNGDKITGEYQDLVSIIQPKLKIIKVGEYEYTAIDTTDEDTIQYFENHSEIKEGEK